MNEEPLISVITPFFNTGKYITETIESVLTQTYSNWELLLIDDGSSDHSSLISKQYSVKYPEYIRYFEHDNHANLGKSTSRNLGISKAKGKFICFLDSDDVFLPSKLELQLRSLVAHPEAAMVFGVTEYWYSWDESSAKKDYIPELGLEPNRLYNPAELAEFFLKKSQYTPCLCSILVRKNTLEKLNGFDESVQDMFEDQVLLYKIFLTESVLAENSCLEKYRQHAESSSAIAILNKSYHPVLPNRSRLVFLTWLRNFIHENNNSPVLERLIQKELRVFEYPAFYSIYLPAKNIIRKIKNRLPLSL